MPKRRLRRDLDGDSTKILPLSTPATTQTEAPSQQPQDFQQVVPAPITSTLLSTLRPTSLTFNTQSTSVSPQLQSTATPSEQNLTFQPLTTSVSVPNTLPNSYTNRSQSGSSRMASPSGAGLRQSFSPSRRPQQFNSYPSFAENLAGGYGSSAGTNYSTSHGTTSTTRNAGDSGFACSFDVLDDVDTTAATTKANGQQATAPLTGGTDVICLGWEGGIDVWKVGRGEVELLGRMSGLTGSVVGAKILPAPYCDDINADLRPLICLTIHSPVVPNPDLQHLQDNVATSSQQYRHSTMSPEVPSGTSPKNLAKEYQTSVEIYSLSQKVHVATLFKSPAIPVSYESVPQPMSLRVEVSSVSGQGNVVVVGVCGSGELYLFSTFRGEQKRRQSLADDVPDGSWRCLTKIWTIVQPESRVPYQSADNGGHALNVQDSSHSKPGVPIFSLEGRWLAYSPPVQATPQTAYYLARNNNSHVGTVCVPTPKLPTTQLPQPQTNTFVDVPEDEPRLNRITREVTQEVIRGARWVGEQGMKAVKSYWGSYGNVPTASSPPSNGIRIGPGGGSGVSVLGMQVREMRERERELSQLGPGGSLGSYPQHGNNTGSHSPTYNTGTTSPALLPPQSSDPVVVSLLDLVKPFASQRQEPYSPIVTFQPLAGLGFLSFAPGGLAILTISYKGDVVHVWDLFQALHQPGTSVASISKISNKSGPSSTVGSPEAGSGVTINGRSPNGHYAARHVRQIARFTRMTVAHVVDVSWSRSLGNKLSILTDKGTVHFYDMPATAYQWPPPRRQIPIQVSQTGVSGIVNTAGQAAAHLLANTQPLVVAARRRRRSSGNGLSTSIGQDSGLGTSAGAQVNANSNSHNSVHRISLPFTSGALSMGCVMYLGGKDIGFIAVMAGGYLRIYKGRNSSAAGRRKSGAQSGVVITDGLEYELPTPPTGFATGVILQNLLDNDIDDDADVYNEEPPEEQLICTGFWTGSHNHHHHRYRDFAKQYVDTPLSFAEIETNAPFPPIHSDRRIKLSVFSDNSQKASLSGDVPWVFGNSISCVKLEVGSARGEVEFKEGSDNMAVMEAMESVLRLDLEAAPQVEVKQQQQKPRRKRRGNMNTDGGTSSDEGFFEDDCEVLDDPRLVRRR